MPEVLEDRNKLIDFFKKKYSQFRSLHDILKEMLKDERLVQEDVLVSHGFLIRQYEIRGDVRKEHIIRLKKEIDSVLEAEEIIRRENDSAEDYLSYLEELYTAKESRKINLRERYLYEIETTFSSLSKISELIASFEMKTAFDIRKNLKNIAENIIKVMQTITILEKLSILAENLLSARVSGEYKRYARVMSKDELKETKSNHVLGGSPARQEGDLVAVFDEASLNNLLKLGSRERRDELRELGISQPDFIVVFRTNANTETQRIHQKIKGLHEIKLQKGIPLEVLEAIAV